MMRILSFEKDRMRRALKILAWVFLALIVIYLLLFTYGRMRGPTPEQEQAIKLLKAQPKFDPATNAEAYIWLMTYDVPSDQEAVITSRDVARYNALTDAKEIIAFKSEAEGKFPKLNMFPEELDKFCQEGASQSCLQEISDNRKKVKKLLVDNNAALRKAERIRGYDSYYTSFETHMAGALPAFHAGHSLLKTHYANLYLDGNHFEAMDKVCRDLRSWRLISMNSDSLITAMIGVSYSRQRMRWLADMVEQMPTDEPIPDSCNQALAPYPAEERFLCKAMQSEYELIENFGTSMNFDRVEESYTNKLTNKLMAVFYSGDLTARGFATTRAEPCLNEAKQMAITDTPVKAISDISNTEYLCDIVEWSANPVGCWFSTQSGTTSFATYRNRPLDLAAQAEATRILLWLRTSKVPYAELQKQFAKRPKDMREFENRIHFLNDHGKTWIVVDLHEEILATGLKQWRLPVQTDASVFIAP
jgi:hypothetical protein